MDPVSITASIAGLVTLAGSLVQLASPLVHAKKEVQTLIDELSTLQNTLEKLKSFLISQPPNAASFGDSSLLQSHVKALSDQLTALHKRLEQTSHSKIRKLAWPFGRNECQDHIAQIRAFSQLIHLSLSIDTYTLLSSTSDDAVQTLGKHIQSLKLLESAEDKITSLELAVKEQTLVLEGKHREDERTKLLDWLSDNAQETRHDRIRRTRTPETGQWFLGHPRFVDWVDSSDCAGLLWCPGEMGSGKANLASLVIDQLRKYNINDEGAVAFFYFSYADAQAQTMTYIIGALVRQLLDFPNRSIPQSLWQLHNKHGSGTSLLQKDLQEALLEIVHQVGKVHFVFDAVDETYAPETRKPFLEFLNYLQRSPKTRVLVTGRSHLQEIHTAFDNCLIIKIKADDHDLRMFVRSQIKTSSCSHIFDDTFEAELCDQLVQSAQGLFLLPALQLKRVLQEPTRGDVEEALQDLPHRLVDIFHEHIGRILEQSRSRKSLALHALMWLCNARSPLSAEQLPDILSLDMSGKRGLNQKYRPSTSIIVECCQGLIYLDEVDQTFHLVHLAVREHIMTHQLQIFGDSTARLVAKACMLYFLDSAFEHGPIIPHEVPEAILCSENYKEIILEGDSPEEAIIEYEILQLLKHYPFMSYLSLNWGSHVHECLSPEVRSLLIQFLDSQARIARSTQIARFVTGYRGMYWSVGEAWSTNGVQMACEFGLTEIACVLLDSGKVQIDSATSIGTTPLIRAAAADNAETVRELLKRGADPLKANWYGNALHCAAERNSVRSLKELLAAGVDPNVLSPTGRSALSCTLDNECVDSAEILLQHDASMNSGAPVASLYDGNLEEVKCSFLRDILLWSATKMLKMVIHGSYAGAQDIADVSKRPFFISQEQAAVSKLKVVNSERLRRIQNAKETSS